MEGIQVSVEKAESPKNIAIIKVGGYIDTTTSAELEHSLNNILKSNCYNIIIDLGNVDYISSAGWGIFISEIKGIREKGGDLKLVKMIPEVYEVFELLEFNHILKAFDSLEEAIRDFDKTSPIARPVPKPEPTGNSSEGEKFQTTPSETAIKEEEIPVSTPEVKQPLSIEDKIRQIVIENPEYGTIQIMKTLNTPRFGNIKLGWFAMRKYLKKLNLDTKKKRIEYFKQKTFG
ncbi:MAG: anti-sigma factor antagonist [Calditrichaeota bacterium]|nr:MAG: anti-sigma factor antagonist [Calditrichota bacterium]